MLGRNRDGLIEGGSRLGPQRIIRRSELRDVTGCSNSTIYEMIANGTFPKPIKLGPRTVGWLAEEIAAWQAERAGERDAAAKSNS